jgi:hypothetical protein
MSWENHERKYPCPCGKSTITSRWREGDFNSQYEDLGQTMDCPKCAKEYVYTQVGVRSDTMEPRIGWIKKEK